MPVLPATFDCCWTASAPTGDFPRLNGDCECDVLVVGAGIAGLSTALALSESGQSIVVLEARTVGRQVSGLSTAKITTQHGLIYRELIDRVGPEMAKAYADANCEGMRQIEGWIARYGIACDYQPSSAYAYTLSPARKVDLVKEAEAARLLGLEARVLARAPLPFETSCALEFPNQAQFNPVSYLVGLARAVEDNGGRVFEHSRASSFDYQQERWKVDCASGTVSARQVVVATHMPVQTPLDYVSPTQPRSHVVMAFRPAAGQTLSGMFIAVDAPTYSIRLGRDAEGPLIIVVGPRFNTGQDGNVAQRFASLEQWVRAHLPVAEARWRWCNEDYDTPDRMAYVGEPDPEQSPRLFVATGFSAWGISNGSAAGYGLAQQIVTGRWPWGALFDPRRKADKPLNQSSDSHTRLDSLASLAPGEGGVIAEGEDQLAVWCDDAGDLHALSAACTHMGCAVTWNNAERTWDCPCHGSIFEADGRVRHGPANKPLGKRSVPG